MTSPLLQMTPQHTDISTTPLKAYFDSILLNILQINFKILHNEKYKNKLLIKITLGP